RRTHRPWLTSRGPGDPFPPVRPRGTRPLNAAQRYRHAALLRSAGYEDAAPLTANSSDGALPQGRELSLAWLSGTILTGFTSVLLMAGALYVSFQGQDTFSTPFEALAIQRPTVASTNAA